MLTIVAQRCFYDVPGSSIRGPSCFRRTIPATCYLCVSPDCHPFVSVFLVGTTHTKVQQTSDLLSSFKYPAMTIRVMFSRPGVVRALALPFKSFQSRRSVVDLRSTDLFLLWHKLLLFVESILKAKSFYCSDKHWWKLSRCQCCLCARVTCVPGRRKLSPFTALPKLF